MEILFASGNAHKATELASLLRKHGSEVSLVLPDGGMPEVEENGDTFAANALIKAEALRSVGRGKWILSDDSGLEVDALGGAPGVRSARYAGAGASADAMMRKLLSALKQVPVEKRVARFVCVLLLLSPEGEQLSFSGTCGGRIAEEVSGNGGFGYDPLFIPDGYEESLGVLGESVKEELSHRAKAAKELALWLKKR